MEPGLGELQRIFYRLITAPSGVVEGLAAEKNLPPQGIGALVRGDARASAIERIEIYASMYFYRLLDAIKEDFPATLAVLGQIHFHNLITGYLAVYPPCDPSINEASRDLAEFAAKAPSLAKWAFIADLIRLERAIVEVFLGPDARSLGPEAVIAIPPTRWPSLRISVHPALRVLSSEWRVEEIVHALEREQPLADPERRPAAILVWRSNYSVNYRPLDELERTALSMIRSGFSFGDVCETAASHGGDYATPGAMSQMLSRWLADGLLVGLDRR
jgi:Putative DNA-binding domain